MLIDEIPDAPSRLTVLPYFTPTGTPDSVVNYLNQEINEVLRDPSFISQLEKDGILIRGNSLADFGDFIKRETSKYTKLLKTIDLKGE